MFTFDQPKPNPLRNILVAVDLKTADDVLLRHASLLAEQFNSKVWVVHIAAPDPDFVGYEIGPVYIRDVRAEELRHEHKRLQQMTSDLKSRSIAAESLLIQGPTVEMLKKEVDKLGIDLLIMGSHKHSFLYEAWIGHTSLKVLHQIPIPTLIIPLPNEK